MLARMCSAMRRRAPVAIAAFDGLEDLAVKTVGLLDDRQIVLLARRAEDAGEHAGIGDDLHQAAVARGPEQHHVKAEIRGEHPAHQRGIDHGARGLFHRRGNDADFVAEPAEHGEILAAQASRDLGHSIRLQRLAQLVEFLEIAALRAADDGAVARHLFEDAFLLEPADGFPHRRPADADFPRERMLGEHVAGGQFTGEELAVDVLVSVFAEGVGGHA